MSRYHAQMFETDRHGNSVFCIPSLSKQIPNEIVKPTKGFDFGSALESYYPLLESVFEYLEVSDLETAKLINLTWCRLAERELNKRTSPTWISFCYDPSLSLRVSKGFRYHTAALCIIAHNHYTIKLQKYVCLHESPEYTRMSFAEYLGKQVVPTGVDYCVMACTEVSRNINEDRCHKSVYQGIFIPVIPNIRVTMFHCNPKHLDRLKFINPNEEIKCVLMFSQKYRIKAVESFLIGLLNGQKPKLVALGGGLIRSTKTFMKHNSKRVHLSDDLFCITFLKDNDTEAEFNAYSAVINGDGVMDINSVATEHCAKFESELLKLKNSSILRSSGIIFRFCCYAKFCKELETEVISKHFPKYPILGLEVDGEIGWNSCSEEEEEESRKYFYTTKNAFGLKKHLFNFL